MSTIIPNSIGTSVLKCEWIELPSELKTDIRIHLINPTRDVNKYLTINDYIEQVDKAIAKDKKVLEDLKSLDDIDHIVQVEYNNSLINFCKDFFRKNYNIKNDSMTNSMIIEILGSNLEKFLVKFNRLSSNIFQNYELDYYITEVTKKVKLDNYDVLFETEKEASLYFYNG